MPISDLLLTGVELMLLGMGIVFVFLVILVFALGIMSRISQFFSTEDPQLPGQDISLSAAAPSKPDNTALIAVISAAVARYRAKH